MLRHLTKYSYKNNSFQIKSLNFNKIRNKYTYSDRYTGCPPYIFPVYLKIIKFCFFDMIYDSKDYT